MSGRRTDRTGRIQRHRTPAEPSVGASWRYLAFGAIAVLVLGLGLVIGLGDLFGQRDTASQADAIPVRMSMAGFEPAVITATAGEDVSLELWTTDAAPHLERGVHTMISDELGIHEELRAESRRTVTLRMPSAPGDYDIYCDTCCGGKQSPSMHGVLRVVEA